MSFEVKLPLFKGPFDLLLFFIERDELDIYDIPISNITNDFLSYLEQLEQLNIEVASEFILVASSLMRIKAKLLIPRPEQDDQGNDIDPRKELVLRLIEYRKYKSVVDDFAELEATRKTKIDRGNVKKELKKLAEKHNVEVELQDVDLYKLLKIFQGAIDKYNSNSENPQHNVIQYPYTIEQQKEEIMDNLEKKEKITFEDIISKAPTKVGVIFNFLAILELLQLKQISIQIGEGFNNFWLLKSLEEE